MRRVGVSQSLTTSGVPNYQGAIEIWKLECKNLNRPITLDDIAPKLIWHTASTTIDHFVVVATSQPANDLVHFLELHPYSFPISLWTGETLFRLLASSTKALLVLGIDSPKGPPSTPGHVYLPTGPMTFDVVHAQDPPRQFAYFRTPERSVLKAYTSLEFKLNLMLGNREVEDAIVTGLKCRTGRYLELANYRIVVQTKVKGIFEPEKILYRPAARPSEETDLLNGKMLAVAGRKLEVLRIELDGESLPGFYELQFLGEASTVHGSQRLASAVYPVFVPGGGEDVALFQVWGRHYDDPVERILDLPDDDWQRVCQRNTRDSLVWLGPLPDEIIRGVAPPSHWVLRGQEAPGDDGVLESTARTLVVLPGAVADPIYSVADAAVRVEGRWEPSRWLSDQLGRRQRLVTRETLQPTHPDDRT